MLHLTILLDPVCGCDLSYNLFFFVRYLGFGLGWRIGASLYVP